MKKVFWIAASAQLAAPILENKPMPVPVEWLTMTADTLLAQSAIDRLTSTAHTLVIEGPSYRQRTRPGTVDATTDNDASSITRHGGPYPLAIRWSHHPGKRQSDRTDTSAAVQPLEDVGVLFRANWPAILVDDNQAGDRRVQGAGAATSRGLRCGVDPTATATTARPSFPSPTF